jgi:hypothetical protein
MNQSRSGFAGSVRARLSQAILALGFVIMIVKTAIMSAKAETSLTPINRVLGLLTV